MGFHSLTDVGRFNFNEFCRTKGSGSINIKDEPMYFPNKETVRDWGNIYTFKLKLPYLSDIINITFQGQGNYWDLEFYIQYRSDRLIEKDFEERKFMIVVGTPELPYWVHEDYNIYRYLVIQTNGFDVLHIWENIRKIELLG